MSITTVIPSGISTEVIHPRPPSPAFGSPLRREAGLAEEEEEAIVENGEEQEVEVILQSAARRERKERRRERESASSDRTRERKRPRDLDEPPPLVGGSKFKLKDVTNSQVSHPTSSLADADADLQRQHTPDDDVPLALGSSRASSSLIAARNFLSTPAPKSSSSLQQTHLLTPRSSSPLPQPPAPVPEAEPTGGRERRTRKSVNYAEPKLNTKMRKPDPPPSVTATKRSSITSSDSDPSRRASPETEASHPPSGHDAGTTSQSATGMKRKKSRVHVLPDDEEESEGTQADAEYGGRTGTGWISAEGRRRSVHSGSSLRRLEGDDFRRHSMAV
ncbi:hypothetical protein IEO21_05146 [Rhodonia placenta]|uniref:Shugoshin C-terminal domain-containing protein n=1 Tax=Rhodonia placenta TaxID=104341 RepID=A0A8H7U1W0_9APHY|nr:hypothetical protein IEO21_05146 [Postia placenta]